jgi:flagellar protein FlgJ
MDNAAAGAAKTLSGFSYTDVNRLSQIKTAGKDGIRAAAQQFESLFIDMVMTTMRQAGSAFADGDYTSSAATKMQQEMLDHQWAVHIAENGGVGLADVLVKQLSGTPGQTNRPVVQRGPLMIAPAAEESIPSMPPQATSGGPTLVWDGMAPEWSVGAPSLPDGLTTAPLAAGQPVPLPDEIVRDDAEDDNDLTVTSKGTKDNAFDGPSDFIDKVLPVLKTALAASGLNPLAVLAQGALETGWGAHVIHTAAGDSSHNLFNIKATSNWDGPSVEVSTVEFHGGVPVRQNDRFRAYESVESAVRDYVSVLKGDSRYSRAIDVAQDPARFADELQKAGYATDPHYAAKILRVLTSGPISAAIAKFAE